MVWSDFYETGAKYSFLLLWLGAVSVFVAILCVQWIGGKVKRARQRKEMVQRGNAAFNTEPLTFRFDRAFSAYVSTTRITIDLSRNRAEFADSDWEYLKVIVHSRRRGVLRFWFQIAGKNTCHDLSIEVGTNEWTFREYGWTSTTPNHAWFLRYELFEDGVLSFERAVAVRVSALISNWPARG